jgi:hypothetical protein
LTEEEERRVTSLLGQDELENEKRTISTPFSPESVQFDVLVDIERYKSIKLESYLN